MSADEQDDEKLWWGQPLDAKRFHIFTGEAQSKSLCESWILRYDGNDPAVDPEEDEFTEGQDCKACSRKAGVLNE